MVTVKTDLTVADINAINAQLDLRADGLEGTERKRLADLMWKLAFLGRAIEIAGQQAVAKDREAGVLGSTSTVSDGETQTS